ncbi:FG-GAP-like repeat-containing protein [Gilvimarinus japonicus]|uniref:FG-GAP-like repeat-containing protein n=1 Tax=Gilvimarinus japonicus TaxID=1796469 RepID=A0ABV7HT25_9GAMM
MLVLRWINTVTVRLVLLSSVVAMLFTPCFARAQKGVTQQEAVSLVKQYCGACHAPPSPQLLPKKDWPRVVDAMAELSAKRFGSTFIPDTALRHIKALYYGSSPERLASLPYIDATHPTLSFSAQALSVPTLVPQIMAITPLPSTGDSFSFLVADAEQGQLNRLWGPRGKVDAWREQGVADIALPVAVDMFDFNGDDLLDYVVADLGELAPNDNRAGKVFVLINKGNGSFAKKLLKDNLRRVSDVNALDLDQDGDTDIALAIFGGQGKGEVIWLENKGAEGYEEHPLLMLSGALSIDDADINNDGIVDLLTLVAQEHETLVAFIGQGKGQFERLDLVNAGHPMFGATSMTVTDLDQDGDQDILFTNGDAFDTQTDPKPYHGVQWLENKGGLNFSAHDVGRYYGAVNAVAADMDNDGDMDVVASSWVNNWDDPKRNALIWYENDGKQNFTPYPISQNYRGLVPLVINDFTGDGVMDILTGSFRMDLLHQSLRRENGVLSFDLEDRAAEAPKSDRLMMFTGHLKTP